MTPGPSRLLFILAPIGQVLKDLQPIPQGWILLAIAAIAHLVLFSPLPLWVRAIAAWAIAGGIPGCLWVEGWVGRQPTAPRGWECGVFVVGSAYSGMILIMLALSYWPGGVSREQSLLAFDGVSLALAVWLWVQNRQPSGEIAASYLSEARTARYQPWLGVGLLLLLVVGGFYRFAYLGYSDFHGDEARAALRATAVLQGYEDVLFLHRKGPAEILLPTVVYALTGQLTEAIARSLFAFANWIGLLAVFVLGDRLWGPLAGWVAALFLALNGYLIGFGRLVQYQSLVFLMGVLVILVLYRLAQHPHAIARYGVLAASFLATGLLAHYEAAGILLPVGYLVVHIQRSQCTQDITQRSWMAWRQWGLPLLVLLLPLLAFYIPFLAHPQFADTNAYLEMRLIGEQVLYNHLVSFFQRATIYNTTDYLVMMIGFTLVALVYATGRLHRAWAGLSLGLVGLGIVVSVWQPTLLTIAGIDFTGVLFLLPLLITWLAPGLPPAERLVWLWFGSLFLLTCFRVARPHTHVYVFFIPWGLLSGFGVSLVWHWGRQWLRLEVARRIALVGLSGAIVVSSTYSYLYFIHHQVEIIRDWEQYHPTSFFWKSYQAPDLRKLFGFPYNEGWRVIPLLYQDGVLAGNYQMNEVIWVTYWYIREAQFCEQNCPYFFLADILDKRDQDTDLPERLRRQGYQLFGLVTVKGNPRLRIYQQDIPANWEPLIFKFEDYQQRFYQQLTDVNFQLYPPIVSPTN
ncbi:ArnT family glycosyltransferase [Trichothermofontia sp.]